MAQQFTRVRESLLRPADVYVEDTGQFPALRESALPLDLNLAQALPAPITVLTADAELGNVVRKMTAGEHDVFVASTLDTAAELAAEGKCGLLITDQALTQTAFMRLNERLRPLQPSMVTIAVGNRGQDNVLLALMASEAVDRFMLKPLTAGLAKIVLDSATREHLSREARRHVQTVKPAAAQAEVPLRPVRAAPPATAQKERFRGNDEITHEVRVERAPEPVSEPAAEPAVAPPLSVAAVAASSPMEEPSPAVRASRPWLAIVAALVAGVLVWWVMNQRMPAIDPGQLIDTNLAAGQAAFAKGRYVEPAEQSALHYYSTVLALDPANAAAKTGIDQIADHLAATAGALIEQGRFAEAVGALQSVRRVRPEHARLPRLEADLRGKLEQQFPQARPAEEEAPPAPLAIDKTPSREPPRVIEARRPVAAPQPKNAALQGRMLADAQQAIDRGQFDLARQLTNAAREVGVARSDLAGLEQSLAAAEQRANERLQPVPPPRPEIQQEPAPARPEAAPVQLAAATGSAVAPVSAPAAAVPPAEPVLVRVVQPDYPGEARVRGIEGWVDLSFVVSPGGDVLEPRVEDSSMKHLFARPALNAVRQWKYAPRAVAGASERTRVRVQFKLNER